MRLSVMNLFDDFEGASMMRPQEISGGFAIEAQSKKEFGHQGSLETWVCCGLRLEGSGPAVDGHVRILVPNGREEARLRAVYSYDRKTWAPVPVQRTSFDFDVPLRPGDRVIYFATFYPYFHSQRLEQDAEIAGKPFVKLETIGTSVRGRDIRMATITSSTQTEYRKKRAYIISGSHGAETAALYGVEGLLDFLVSDDPQAEEMRRRVIWKVIPLLNVDAAVEGLDRRNAGGVNLYFDWGEPDVTISEDVYPVHSDPSVPPHGLTQPETQAAFRVLSEFRPDVFVDIHSWHFDGDGYWGPETAAEGPQIAALKRFIAEFFHVRHWLHEDLPFASTPSVARQFKIATAQPELALSLDSDGQEKNPASMRKQGAQIVKGVYEYLKTLPDQAESLSQ